MKIEIETDDVPLEKKLDVCMWCSRWWLHPMTDRCLCAHSKYICLTIHEKPKIKCP